MNVVSFYAPRPEHPFFQDYRPFLALLRLSCERFGHNHLVLTDDPMEVGADDAYVVDLPRSLMKATIAAQLAYLSDPAMADVPTLLTGADCVLANDPDWFAANGGDRPDLTITTGDFADCRMNCGAIYIPRPAVVARIWRRALELCGDDWGDDQTSLYQAIRESRASVREWPVDPYNLAPEHPGDDCTRGVVLHFRGPRKRWMVNYCHDWLGLGGGFRAVALPNTAVSMVIARMKEVVALGLPEVEPSEAHKDHAVIVGGGPSVLDMIPEIMRRQAAHQTIFALNGAGHYLSQYGVIPNHCVILDARADNARFVRDLPFTFCLLASQCHQDVFDAAAGGANASYSGGSRIRVWHAAYPEIGDPLPARDPPRHYVRADICVGLTAMSLVYMMGYRKIHLYGYDSSDRNGKGHAYPQAEDEEEQRRVEAWCGGRRFDTTITMYAQAQAFPACANLLAQNGAIITVHGDGLLPTIARHMNSAIPLQGEAA